MVPLAKLPLGGTPSLLNQETVPVYPVPAVVVVTGVAPATGAATPAIAATEMTVGAGPNARIGRT